MQRSPGKTGASSISQIRLFTDETVVTSLILINDLAQSKVVRVLSDKLETCFHLFMICTHLLVIMGSKRDSLVNLFITYRKIKRKDLQRRLAMNVALFLSPKNDIVYLYDDMTVRQAMEKMEYHRYQCLPVLTRDGRYSGVITEGDLLWAFKNSPDFRFQDAEHMTLYDIPRHFCYEAIPVGTDMDSLINTAYRQSFVPVVDDTQAFIGLVKRSDIIHYIYQGYSQLKKAGSKPALISQRRATAEKLYT